MEAIRIDRHGSRTLNEVWNPDTLAWEAMSQTQVTVGSLTVSGVAITNWPMLIDKPFDAMTPGYTGSDMTSLVYTLGGVTVYTLGLTYLNGQITGITRS